VGVGRNHGICEYIILCPCQRRLPVVRQNEQFPGRRRAQRCRQSDNLIDAGFDALINRGLKSAELTLLFLKQGIDLVSFDRNIADEGFSFA